MIWSWVVISFASNAIIDFVNWITHNPSLVQSLKPTIHSGTILFIILELVLLWQLNSKALYLCAALSGLWIINLLLRLFYHIVIHPDSGVRQIVSLLVLVLINFIVIAYITRHSFLDQCEAAKKELVRQKYEKDSLKRAMEMDKRRIR